MIAPAEQKRHPVEVSSVPHYSTSTQSQLNRGGGLAYLVLTVACGAAYLAHLAPSLTNDLYWPHYNRSGYEIFLIDLVNVKLNTNTNCTIDVISTDAMTTKKYESTTVQAEFGSGYTRRVLHSEASTLEFAIRGLRITAMLYIPAVYAQYCWVDFDRRWDVAHTAARSHRCLAKYKDNAANYLEMTLRNTNWTAFFATYRTQWNAAVGWALQSSAAGIQWLQDRPVHAKALSVEDEVRYLQQRNLTRYELQWRNDLRMGVAETMEIENPFQQRQLVPIKTLPPILGPWTTLPLFWCFSNDLGAMEYFNMSIVRGDPNHFEAAGWDMSMFFGMADQNNSYVDQVGVFYHQVSPFGSVDMLYTPPPPSLLALDAAFRTVLGSQLWPSPAIASAYLDLADVLLTPQPPNFKRDDQPLTYYGGNLLCFYNPGAAFPQSQFSFDDPCTTPKPFAIVASKEARVFALLVTGATDVQAICSLQSGPLAACVASLADTMKVVAAIGSTDLPSLASTTSMPLIQFYQYAQNTSMDWQLLEQPLIVPGNPSWSFYGWIAIYDWVQGSREVVRIEGDVSTKIVMSEVNPVELLPSTSQAHGEQTAPKTIYYLVAYTTIFSGVLAFVLAMYAVQHRFLFRPKNLLMFNHVACFVWIGRPLLLLRGLTAILLLSSNTTKLVREAGYSKLLVWPRSAIETMVVAGESTWITYVLSDVLLIATGHLTQYFASLASTLAWVVTWALTLQSPISLTATLNRECSGVNTDRGLDCSAGVIQTGNSTRIVALLAIHGISVAVSILVVCLWKGRQSKRDGKAPLLLHGAAETFLDDGRAKHSDLWELDHVACVMSGLVPFPFRGANYTFDVKLWVVIQDNAKCHLRGRAMSLRTPSFASGHSSSESKMALVSGGVWWQRVTVFSGFLYAVVTGAGSVSYIAVSTVNFANDFYWATFNMTGHHVVLAELFSQQVPLRTYVAPTRLDDPRWVTSARNYSDPKITFSRPPLLGIAIQSRDLTGLEAAIAGLRSSDPCAVPWIATQYCWVDFARRWPMANTMARQQRCLAEVANGAVYLESVLRNVVWNEWAVCWSREFAIGIGTELKLTSEGQRWLEMVQGTRTSPTAEVQHWKAAGIATFEVQWQNFKKLGLINTYAIENALGVQHPMTLSRTNGSYDFAGQTSFKMYWQFASDLWAVGANATRMSGKSLVRTSANYAFANQTMATVLVQNRTLMSPLFEAFTLVQQLIGPLGSIDVKIIPCPEAVRTLNALAIDAIRRAMAMQPAAATRAYRNYTFGRVTVVPTKFKQMTGVVTFGGNLLCQESPSSVSSIRQIMVQLTGRDGTCEGSGSTSFFPYPDIVLVALLAARLGQANASTMQRVCWHELNPTNCVNRYLSRAVTMVRDYVPQVDVDALDGPISQAAAAVRQLNVSFAQYVRAPRQRLQLVTATLLDPADPTFEYWSWAHLLEWAGANREVIRFQGDSGVVTVVSEYTFYTIQAVHMHDLPTTFASYARSGVQYVTGVMLGIAGLLGVCIVTSQGRIEGLNIFEMNRVAGIVWVGRPLLLLRGVTALCLLSTATLELQLSPVAPLAMFAVPTLPWYKTILGAGETTWLVYILNDIMTVWTKQYTQYTAPIHSMLVWIAAAILTLVDPVVHHATVEPQCSIDQVDFQLVCQSGVVAIGSVSRLYWLLGIIGICTVVTVVAARAVHGANVEAKAARSSLLLSSGAKYLFDHKHWMHCDVYYMDAASVLLNGLLTVRWGTTTYVVDVKIWRSFVIELDQQVPPRIALATPLTD